MFKKVILITTLLAQNSMAIAQSSDIQSWEEKLFQRGIFYPWIFKKIWNVERYGQSKSKNLKR